MLTINSTPVNLYPHEKLSAGLERILRQLIEYNIHLIQNDSIAIESRIHSFRKIIKIIRAIIKASRYATGKKYYYYTNFLFRDLNRTISELRDKQVYIDTYYNICNMGKLGRFNNLERKLFYQKARLYRKRNLQAKIRFLSNGLVQSLKVIENFGHKNDEIRYKKGLTKMYLQGKKAFYLAMDNPSTENKHEWRKKIKYLWHQLQIFNYLEHEQTEATIKTLEAISDTLGFEHDMKELENFLLTKYRLSYQGKYQQFLSSLNELSQQNFTKAKKLGNLFYSSAPSDLSILLEARLISI